MSDRTINLSQDGSARCATYNDFANLMESPAGFGDTDIDAITELLREAPMRCRQPKWYGWGGPAGHCDEPAYGPEPHMRELYREWYLSHGIARCENHGGPSLARAAIDLRLLSVGLSLNKEPSL
jgi:hypothetical protein